MDYQELRDRCQDAVASLDGSQLEVLIKYLRYFIENRKDENQLMREFYAGNTKAASWIDWINKWGITDPDLLFEVASQSLAKPDLHPLPPLAPSFRKSKQNRPPAQGSFVGALIGLLVVLIIIGLIVTYRKVIATAFPASQPFITVVEGWMNTIQKSLTATTPVPTPQPQLIPTQQTQVFPTPVPTQGNCNDTACLTTNELKARGQNPQALSPDGQTLQQTWENTLKALWIPSDTTTSLARWRNMLDASYGQPVASTPMGTPATGRSPTQVVQPTYPPINDVKGTPTPNSPPNNIITNRPTATPTMVSLGAWCIQLINWDKGDLVLTHGTGPYNYKLYEPSMTILKDKGFEWQTGLNYWKPVNIAFCNSGNIQGTQVGLPPTSPKVAVIPASVPQPTTTRLLTVVRPTSTATVRLSASPLPTYTRVPLPAGTSVPVPTNPPTLAPPAPMPTSVAPVPIDNRQRCFVRETDQNIGYKVLDGYTNTWSPHGPNGYGASKFDQTLDLARFGFVWLNQSFFWEPSSHWSQGTVAQCPY